MIEIILANIIVSNAAYFVFINFEEGNVCLLLMSLALLLVKIIFTGGYTDGHYSFQF